MSFAYKCSLHGAFGSRVTLETRVDLNEESGGAEKEIRAGYLAEAELVKLRR